MDQRSMIDPQPSASLRSATRTPSPTPSISTTTSGNQPVAARGPCAVASMPIESIARAILSVSDKTGIVELARVLLSKHVEILSTGGTAKHLADNGIEATSIAQWSGAPQILGGRVKTLTPKVFGAILHDPDNAAHRDHASPPRS